jgi:hypothetical protein
VVVRRQTSVTGRAGVHQVGLAVERDLRWIFREQPIEDHGIDAQIEIVESSLPTGRLVALQIKSGPTAFRRATDTGWWFYLASEHVEYWSDYSLPVAIVLSDLSTGVCYLTWDKLVRKVAGIGPAVCVDLGEGLGEVGG